MEGVRNLRAEAPPPAIPSHASRSTNSSRTSAKPRPARVPDAGSPRLAVCIPGPITLGTRGATEERWKSSYASAAVPDSSQLHRLLSYGSPWGEGDAQTRLSGVLSAEMDIFRADRDPQDVLRSSPRMEVVGEPPLSPMTGGGQDKDFYLQCGVAVRTLREEIPKLFEHDLTYDIYRDDITFIDHISSLPGGSMVTHGKDSYRRLTWSVRFHGTLFFSALQVQILRIWQPREKTISLRWKITGNPRVLHSLGASEVQLDGISEYSLDSNGMIYEHKIESVDWNANHSTLKALNLFPTRSMTPSFFFTPFRRKQSPTDATGASRPLVHETNELSVQ